MDDEKRSQLPHPTSSDDPLAPATGGDWKSTALRALTELNETHTKQSASRWNDLKIYYGGLAFLVTLLFGYQVLKVEQVTSLANSLRDTTDAVRRQAQAELTIMSSVARTSAYLQNGYREFYREDVPLADIIADAALREIDDARTRALELVADVHRLDPDHAREVEQTLLRRTIVPTQVAALELKARALFFLDKFQDAEKVADKILDVDGSNSWAGNHFKAIAIGSYRDPGDERLFEEELKYYRNSFAARPRFNADYYNAGEACFEWGRFADAREFCQRYLADYGGQTNAGTYVAEFLKEAAEFAIDSRRDARKMETVLDQFENAVVQRRVPIRLTFDANALKRVQRQIALPDKRFASIAESRRQSIVAAIGRLVETLGKN